MYRTDPPAAYWRDQVIQWGPRVLFAILILVATHFIAKAVQWGVAKGIDQMPVLKRHPVSGALGEGNLYHSHRNRHARPFRQARALLVTLKCSDYSAFAGPPRPTAGAFVRFCSASK